MNLPEVVMQNRRVALATALGLALLATRSARAADQTVLGKSFGGRDPMPGVDASLRSVVVLGKEPASDDTVAGNPITDGASVEIIANGTSPSSQIFSLPAGALTPGAAGWKAIGTVG